MILEELPKSERPRERFLNYGKDYLSNEELLAIILKTGTRGKSVKELSMEVLKEINKVEDLQELSMEKITKINGIGKVKAIELIASIELGKRICLSCEERNRKKLQQPKEIFEEMRYLLRRKKQEHFYCLYFNSKRELIEKKLLFIGTTNRSIVHPREVFKEAYLSSAASIICVHNHPSGDVTPSREDIYLTEKLVEIGRMNGIPITDHIIISDNAYYSFCEHRMLKE